MTQPSRVAIFPGSFDPFTVGHVDILDRAARLFDRVIVGVLVNADKRPMFSADERVAIIREVITGRPGLEVEAFDGLLADLARRRGASAVVRGLRNAADFDYEQPMALMNRHLVSSLETVFLVPDGRVAHVSARLVRDIAANGGSVAGLVPPGVEARLAARRHAATSRPV
jgi:pantetheine-phosphate adenylyltransferase